MIRIVYLYPVEMNIYGDTGNVIALLQRCHWRGFKVSVHYVNPGDKLEIEPGDILFMGGGQDSGQARIVADLQRKAQQLHQAITAGTPALTICGGYQLFGRYFKDQGGQRLEGIGIFKAHTEAGAERLIGNLVIESKLFGQLVGFENHSGRTYLDSQQDELGVVKKGFGNNGQDQGEGAVVNNAIGTYMHGSFLPKNPLVADWLIAAARRHSGQDPTLEPLDDTLEHQAAQKAATRP